jgi:N-acetyl sugar amidotransferase
MKYCTRCMMPETRPRIQFDEDGVCNACRWASEKKDAVDWSVRWKELEDLCDKHRKRKGFDCLVPVSGGKDSSYVALMMKERMGMHPLCVTLKPPLEMEVGRRNLDAFIDCGFDHVHVTPNPDVARVIARDSLVEKGQPLHAWIISVQTGIFRLATQFDIPFVMFGEEGETEYGGSSKLKHSACYSLEDSISLYLSGIDLRALLAKHTEKQATFWTYPETDDFRRLDPAIAHWSYFENWDSYEHYLIAKDRMGLQETSERCIGTYNNFAQTDTTLYDLHVYLMYLKFGFGRCTQDVGIDIRRGAMTRKQALALVRRYDGEAPEIHFPAYREYFRMTEAEFEGALERHVNKNLFRREGSRWVPTFVPE